MTNAESKMKIVEIETNELKKWCVDFASNYPRTAKYAKEIMVEESEMWPSVLRIFIVVQATAIAMGFKIGKYDQRLKSKIDTKTREMFIDAFTTNYLKNATTNINTLWYACGDWDRVLNSVLSIEALKADCYVDRAITKHGAKK